MQFDLRSKPFDLKYTLAQMRVQIPGRITIERSTPTGVLFSFYGDSFEASLNRTLPFAHAKAEAGSDSRYTNWSLAVCYYLSNDVKISHGYKSDDILQP